LALAEQGPLQVHLFLETGQALFLTQSHLLVVGVAVVIFLLFTMENLGVLVVVPLVE
jgi:hypothetical protein